MKRWSVVVLIGAGAMFLGATVVREPLVYAAQAVSVTILGPLDNLGNLRVHEQGTVWVRDAHNPAFQPFQHQMSIHFVSNEADGCAELDVPGRANKRLVIEFVSAEFPGDREYVRVWLATTAAGTPVGHFLMATRSIIDGSVKFSVSEAVKIYAIQARRYYFAPREPCPRRASTHWPMGLFPGTWSTCRNQQGVDQ